MLKRSFASICSLSLVVLVGTVQAQSAADSVEVEGAYVRAVPPGLPNSASFMSLHNHDSQAHALVAAESPAAKFVELHTHNLVDGMMQMRTVDEVALPAQSVTRLQPGGLHVMLIGLREKLVPGKSIPMTLTYEDGSSREISVPIHRMRMHLRQQDDSDHGKHHGQGEHTPLERYRQN
jgi:copper(I)-binding protein